MGISTRLEPNTHSADPFFPSPLPFQPTTTTSASIPSRYRHTSCLRRFTSRLSDKRQQDEQGRISSPSPSQTHRRTSKPPLLSGRTEIGLERIPVDVSQRNAFSFYVGTLGLGEGWAMGLGGEANGGKREDNEEGRGLGRGDHTLWKFREG